MRRLSAFVLAGAMILAGCSSGGVKTEVSTTTLFPPITAVMETTTTIAIEVEDSAPEIEYADHSIEFIPIDDSFSFENFGGGEAPADLTVNMARRLYGDDQVCSDVTDNKCTPYPVILQLIQQANKSMQGGLCEGLAVLSLRLAGDLGTLASYQGTDTVSQLIKEDPALLSEIAYWYVTQFAVEVQQEASSFLEMSPKKLAEILLYDFAQAELGKPHTGFTVGIYSDHGGHAVTPYRVEQTEDGYKIFVYDSNWPNAERWIDVDDDGWIYALAATNPSEEASAWSGGVGTMELTPMKIRSGPFTCGFCPTEGSTKSGTLLTVAASGDKQMSLKIVTESGQRLGYYDEGFINEIPGATYRYLISGPSTSDPVLVFLPPEVETFSADVEEIYIPEAEETIKEDVEEEEEIQKFSLLLLNEEKSVQIEAVVETEPEEIVEEDVVEEEVVVEEKSLIAFSEESIEIAEIEEATVAIAVDALEVEIDLERGQQIEVTFDVEQPASDVEETEEVIVEEPQMMGISIADDVGEVLAEVEVDVSQYRVEARVEEPATTVPNQSEVTVPVPEPVIVPVIIEISYDIDVGEIVQEEEQIEAWVASDAEYFQAVADDNLAEVVGESWAEEIEEVIEWEPEEEDAFDLTAVILSVDEEYWEDEQWEEMDYDEEWFEEQLEEEEEWFNEEFDIEEVYEFIEEIEEEQEFVRLEIEEYEILEEFGVEEWNEELMGPAPTETVDWTDDDWEEYDEEMDAVWEEQMEDPEAWEEELLEDMGVEEWDPDWGPSPTEAADWTEDDWDAYDQEWAVEEEAQILAEEGLEEWPEDWGPSPSESVNWTDEDWEAYDAEQELLWEVDNEDDTDWSLEEDWSDEDWMEEEDEDVSEDDFRLGEDDEWENWSGEDEEAWILEEEGLDEWPEDWGPSPTETWDWEEDDWEAYDEEQEQAFLEMLGELSEEEFEQWEEETIEELEEMGEWSGEDEELWILEQEGLEEWPEDWGPSPSESWDWTDEDWEEHDAEQFLEMLEELTDEEIEDWEDFVEGEEEWYDDDWEDEYEEGNEETSEDGDETGWGDAEPEGEEEDEWLEGSEEEVDEDWLEEELEEEWEDEWLDDDEPEPDGSISDEEEVDEEQVDETEMPLAEEDEEEREEGLDEEEQEEEWEWENEGTNSDEWDDQDDSDGDEPVYEDEQELEEDIHVEVEETEEESSWDPYAECRGTDACNSAPGGFETWDDYDQQNDPAYYEDWGELPGGYATWADFTQEVEAGIVNADFAAIFLPEDVQEEYIPEPVVVEIYYPTITYSTTTEDNLEDLFLTTSTSLTSQLVETDTTSILAQADDGNWYTTDTTVTSTTNSYVDTTTLVARTGTTATTCSFVDGVQSGCQQADTVWNDPTTTVNVGDAYGPGLQAVTVVADPVAQSCDQGGWTGMGDWCIVQSSGRSDRETVGFVIPGTTGTDPPVQIRIDAESNLTYAGWGAGSNHDDEHGDPYIFLFQDNDTDVGEHSGDTSEITIGVMVEANDDGGRDCDDNGGWQACLNPPSGATDTDETPNVTMSDGTAVIDNIVDAWDSRIDRALNPGHYAVQGATYNTATGGWYRLTIREDD